ncbi:MAG: amidohydrolase family protein [Lentisphaeria bacterium]|nr:amidohydrolase family protein [Lentisphaeria bacterium]
MFYDFHAHFDKSDRDLISVFVKNCEKNQTRTVLSGGSMGGYQFVCNEEVIKYCREYHDWLLPALKIDLWDTAPDISQIRKFKDLGCVSAKCIYPYYEYDHDLYMPVYEELEKLDMPVLFHTGCFFASEKDIQCQRPALLNMDPLRLDRIARSFPKLKIVAAHLGTSFFRVQAAQLTKSFGNVYSDLAGSGAWKGMTPEEVGSYMIDIMDRSNKRHFKKLVFGSDCYVSHPELQTEAVKHYLNILQQNGLDADAIAGIMGGTVAGWLGL